MNDKHKTCALCALSDLHGNLPDVNKLRPVDVMVICGDTVPLNIQRNDRKSLEWFCIVFTEWVKHVPADQIILIGGNHDFWMANTSKQNLKACFDKWTDGKVTYLQDELYEYQGVTFYGCPWCEGPHGWAFCPGSGIVDVVTQYESIPHCDVLITHAPPKIGNVGVSDPETSFAHDWGSEKLRLNIKDKDIIVNFCGHVHSGNHEATQYPTPGCSTIFYNTSLLDEEYEMHYSPRYVTIDTENKTVTED